MPVQCRMSLFGSIRYRLTCALISELRNFGHSLLAGLTAMLAEFNELVVR